MPISRDALYNMFNMSSRLFGTLADVKAQQEALKLREQEFKLTERQQTLREKIEQAAVERDQQQAQLMQQSLGQVGTAAIGQLERQGPPTVEGQGPGIAAMPPEVQRQMMMQGAMGLAQTGQPGLLDRMLRQQFPTTEEQLAQAQGLANLQQTQAKTRREEQAFERAEETRQMTLDMLGQAIQKGQQSGNTGQVQRLQAAALTAYGGNTDAALQQAFPNIKEPSTLFQALLQQGKTPEQAGRIAADIESRPTEASLALKAAQGNKQAREALKFLGRKGKLFSVDKDGNVLFHEGENINEMMGNVSGPFGLRAQEKAMESMNRHRTTAQNMASLFQLIQRNPDVATSKGTLTQIGQNLRAQIMAFQPEGTTGKQLQDRLAEVQDIGSYEFLTEAVAYALAGSKEPGKLTDADLDSARRQLGLGKSFMGLRTQDPAVMLAALSQALETLQGVYDRDVLPLRLSGAQIPPLVQPKQFTLDAPKPTAPSVPPVQQAPAIPPRPDTPASTLNKTIDRLLGITP